MSDLGNFRRKPYNHVAAAHLVVSPVEAQNEGGTIADALDNLTEAVDELVEVTNRRSWEKEPLYRRASARAGEGLTWLGRRIKGNFLDLIGR